MLHHDATHPSGHEMFWPFARRQKDVAPVERRGFPACLHSLVGHAIELDVWFSSIPLSIHCTTQRGRPSLPMLKDFCFLWHMVLVQREKNSLTPDTSSFNAILPVESVNRMLSSRPSSMTGEHNCRKLSPWKVMRSSRLQVLLRSENPVAFHLEIFPPVKPSRRR